MKEELLSVMREFYHDGIPEGVVPRDVEYVEKLRASTVVKGMRRTGKTFVTYERMKRLVADGIPLKRIVHVNFEDERLSKLTVDDLHLIGEVHAELCPEFSDGKVWYFLDELQCVDGWESYARRLVDSPNVQLCLTGSSSKLLSEEIATQMRGRSLPIEVFPLSFPEYLRFNGILGDVPKAGFTAREKGVLRKAMSDYAERGGFPDVQDVSSGMRAAMLQEYVDAVLYRDIIERHEVASVQALKYTLEYLFHNYARKTSTRSISGVLKNLSVPANRES
ncbi:MAG: ATP-binding protein, partial [Lentisphaerae bacterium]|nr:ATP-binding protein [Lentisphaerota bacterium]